MKAIILAGGEGTRLRPLTCDIPKPMLKLVNAPLIEHCVRLLKKHGITDIAVTEGYMPGKISGYLGSGTSLGVRLSYFREKKPLGTAGSLKNAASFIDGDFIVIGGGIVTDIDLSSLIDFHLSHSGIGTLGLTRLSEPVEHPMVSLDADGKVSRFLDRADWSRASSTLVSTGIYVLSPKLLSFISDDTFTDLCRDIFPSLPNAQEELYGMQTDGYWCDIGDLNAYRRCSADALDKKVRLELPEETQDGIWLEEGANVEQGAILCPPVYVGSGSRIMRGARVEANSIIGRDVCVCAGAGIKRSILMDKCRVEENAQLRGAVADREVVFGRGSAVYEQAVIGRGSVLGENCAVKPTVKIWPHKELPADSVQRSNLIWGNCMGGKIWTKSGIRGELGIEITPEAAARLGAALGTIIGGERLAVSDHGSPASAMLKDALTGGALSTGVRLYDFGEQPLPISRSGVRFYRMGGGASVNVYSKGGTDYAEIRVLNSGGADPTDEFMAELRHRYETEDFSRSGADSICEAEYLFEYKLFYLKNLINSTKKQDLGYKLIIGCGSEWAQRLLKSAGNDLSCHVEASDEQSAAAIAEKVKAEGADLGAVIDPSCQALTLIDCAGRILDPDSYTLLCSMIVMKSYENAKIYVPVSAPSGVEELASKYGATVVRTRNSPPALMHELTKTGEDMLRDQFIYTFDAVGALIKLLDYMKERGVTLSELISMLPETHMVHTSVSCKERAAAMEKVYKLHRDQAPDMTDGLKLSFDKGWVLILPSESSPAITVTSQGYCEEYARELADICVDELLS